jgi:PAS domain S-box-containing protein
MFPFWNSLRFRLILLVILGIVPSLFLILFNGMEQRRAAINHAQETASQLAKELSKDYEVLVQTTRHMLTSLAQDPVLRDQHSADRSTLFETRLRDRLLPFFANIGVADLHGNVIYSAVPLRQPVNVADGSCFRQTVETRSFSAGGYGVGRIGGKRTLHFAYPVLDKEGNLTGVTFAAVDLAWIQQVLALTRTPYGATVTLVDEQGTILVRHPDPDGSSGKPAVDKEIVRKVLRTGEGVAEATGLDGLPKLFGFAPLGISARSGYIYVGLPKGVVVSEANRVLMRSLIWLAAAGLLGLAAAWFFTYLFVMRRVNTLVGAARQLSSDNLQARTRLDPNSSEIGHLGSVFDHMAESLEIRERERKAMQDELLQEEQFSDAMMESLPGFFYIFDEQLRPVRWNKSAEIVTGYSADEISRMRAFDFIDEADLPVIKEGLKEVFEKGEASREARLVSKNGEKRSHLFNGRLFTVNGKRYLAGMALDIEDRKQAEESLRQSEYRYRMLFEDSRDAAFVTARDGTLIDANQSYLDLFKYGRADIIGRKVHQTYADAEARKKFVEEIKPNGSVKDYEVKLLKKDGSKIDALITASVRKDSDGTLIGYQGIIRDVTQLKRWQEERNRLAIAVDQAADTIAITDEKGWIQYVNPAFEAVSGRTRSELIGKNIRTLKIRDDDPEYFKNMWETITSGHVWKDRVVQNQKNGQTRVVNVTVSPVRNSSGNIIAFVGIGHDVTEQVQLEAKLLQAQKMEAIGTLAGGIAHDFNNLLQVILGYSELMLAERKPTESDYADLERMRKAARSGAELVQRLLTFSRKVEPKPIPMDLNRQIRLVEKLLSRTLPKMIQIQVDPEEGLPEIAADPTQIEQVLMNLAVNARDAMPEGGRLIIGTTKNVLNEADCRALTGARPGEYVVLSVSDTGQGMDSETLEHIFEPFFTTKELGRGTGLGLATVYGICRQHGGFITCRSQVGQGATFSAFFPALERETVMELADSGVMPAFGTETILLVDDEDLVRDLGERILSRVGYTVLTAGNGRQALEIYEQEGDRIALIVLDLIMPEMGGRPCLKEILKLNPEARVLIASGYAGDLPVTESLQIGAKAFVGKPFRMNELLQQVRRVLDAKP